MENIIKVERTFKTDPNDTVTGVSEIRTSRTIIDLLKVSDYESYTGDMVSDPQNYTLVLVEHNIVSEWKIIKYKFEDFHNLYQKFMKYLDGNIGLTKLN